MRKQSEREPMNIPEDKQLTIDLLEARIEELAKENERLLAVIDEIDKALTVPAAEYVPAITDAFSVIDKVRKSLKGAADE